MRMNSDQLYEQMKDAWDYLGVGFHGKHLVTTWIEGKHLVLAYKGNQVRIEL